MAEEGEREETGLTVEIDGAFGEGGGQILRVSLALSAVTGIPVHIRNVRVKRSPPGLRAQHRTAVEAVARLSAATIVGLELGSTEVKFTPSTLGGGRLVLDTGTAGSTTLVLQCLLPAMLFSEGRTEVEVRGGTNNPLAPPVDYFQRVLVPILSTMGSKMEMEVARRGFYPRGGGIMRAGVSPLEVIYPIELNVFEEVASIKGIAYSSRLPGHIVSRMVRTVHDVFQRASHVGEEVNTEVMDYRDPKCALSPGCGIVLTASVLPKGILGADSLGEVGKSAERVGEEAAEALLRLILSMAPVDCHLGDQLIIYMALAEGNSVIRVSELTSHIESCIYACESFFGRIFRVSGELGRPTTIFCEGVGFSRSQRRATRARLL